MHETTAALITRADFAPTAILCLCKALSADLLVLIQHLFELITQVPCGFASRLEFPQVRLDSFRSRRFVIHSSVFW